MIEYGNKASNRNAKSGATKSQFGNVGRNIDFESEKPKLQTHGFAESAKPVEEQRAKESVSIREELDKVEKNEEEKTDRSNFKREDAKPTVRPAPAKTDDELVSKHVAGGVFSKAWTVSDHVTVPEVIEPMRSSFLPNFISATIIIEAMEHCIDGVEELKWISPYYFSLPARIYWAVLFYVQILKAKEAAKKLTKTESTWFRAFKRIYPLESLPVAGPLVPFYANITSVKPNDDKYDFVFPDYIRNLGMSVEKGVPNVTVSFFLQPNLLLITDFLRRYTRLTRANFDETIQAGGERYFNDDGTFVPNRIGEDFTFAGIDYPAALTVATATTLSGQDLDKPLPETKQRLIEIHPYWKRAKVANIPQANTTDAYDNIGASMRMVDDFEWFEDCIEMATTQCKFFSDSINMSQIPATGGTEVLISAHITGRHREYKASVDWYPNHWSNLKSQFRTTRADATYEQFFNAAYALSTATISWTSNNHPIGGRQIGHRVGPYWRNREFQFEQPNDIEVMRRILTMIRSLFFESHGQASI